MVYDLRYRYRDVIDSRIVDSQSLDVSIQETRLLQTFEKSISFRFVKIIFTMKNLLFLNLFNLIFSIPTKSDSWFKENDREAHLLVPPNSPTTQKSEILERPVLRRQRNILSNTGESNIVSRHLKEGRTNPEINPVQLGSLQADMFGRQSEIIPPQSVEHSTISKENWDYILQNLENNADGKEGKNILGGHLAGILENIYTDFASRSIPVGKDTVIDSAQTNPFLRSHQENMFDGHSPLGFKNSLRIPAPKEDSRRRHALLYLRKAYPLVDDKVIERLVDEFQGQSQLEIDLNNWNEKVPGSPNLQRQSHLEFDPNSTPLHPTMNPPSPSKMSEDHTLPFFEKEDDFIDDEVMKSVIDEHVEKGPLQYDWKNWRTASTKPYDEFRCWIS